MHVGKEPSLCAKYDIMFSNIVATRQYVWTPSQGLLSDEDNRAAEMRNTTNEETNIEEGSGDSEEDAIPDFIHDVSNMVGGNNVAKVVATTIVQRERVHHLNARKRRGELEWEHNYSHVSINLLSLSSWTKKAQQLLEIKKDVALKR